MTTISKPVSAGPTTAPARRNGWLAGLAVILLIVGLGVGFLVGRASEPDIVLPSDLAGTNVTKMLDDYLAALNAGDAAKIASFLATDATFTDTTGGTGDPVKGNAQIAKELASYVALGFETSEPGTAIQTGEYVARYNISSVGPAMAVYQVRDGKIQNVWIVRQ